MLCQDCCYTCGGNKSNAAKGVIGCIACPEQHVAKEKCWKCSATPLDPFPELVTPIRLVVVGEDGDYISPPICESCGLLIGNKGKHESWHMKVDM